MKEGLRKMMARAEEAWREYHEGGKVSAWELSERLEEEEGIGDGEFRASIGFDPIFRNAFVKAFWWERPTRYCIARLCYSRPFGWELRVTCQGEQCEMERICFELAEEGLHE